MLNLQLSSEELHLKMTTNNHLMNKVIFHLDMFAVTVKNRIGSEICCEDVITEESNTNLYQNAQVKKQLTKALNFNSGIGGSTVFSFSRRTGDSGMFLGFPGDEIGTQKEGKASCGLTTIETANPIRVAEGHNKIQPRAGMKP